jgi:hypothetical protein
MTEEHDIKTAKYNSKEVSYTYEVNIKEGKLLYIYNRHNITDTIFYDAETTLSL